MSRLRFHVYVILCLVPPAIGVAAEKAPALVERLNNGNWLSQAEAESLRNELFYQRAVHTYMTMLPALNVIGMRDGSEGAFGAGYNVCRSGRIEWIAAPGCRRPTRMSFIR